MVGRILERYIGRNASYDFNISCLTWGSKKQVDDDVMRRRFQKGG